MAEKLSPVQANVLTALRGRADRGEAPPTYRELCAEFGWRSTGTPRDHIRALVRKGRIDVSPGRRSRKFLLKDEPCPVARVPLLGRVPAGDPVFTEENFERRIPVPADWARSGDHFAVRVTGESMTGAGILDGDIAVVRRQETVRDGAIVVAIVDGEVTLKRLRRAARGVFLTPENPSFRPLAIRKGESPIRGVVVGLVRSFNT